MFHTSITIKVVVHRLKRGKGTYRRFDVWERAFYSWVVGQWRRGVAA